MSSFKGQIDEGPDAISPLENPKNVRYTLHEMLSKLYTRLKEIRQSRGLTQEALAEQVGVTRQTIIAIEKLKYVPSVKLALDLADALAVPLNELFGLEKPE